MSLKLADIYNQTRNARKVVLVDMGFLGDSIHLLPGLWEIKRHYPQAELHVVAAPLGAEFLRLAPCVDRIWPVARNPKQPHWWRDWQTIRAMRREQFDLAINFSGADRTLFWTVLTGARRRVAHTGPRTHFWSRWLIPYWVPRQPPGMPVFEQRRQVLAACGLSLALPCWDMSLPKEAGRKAESLVPAGSIHFSVSASSPLKEWPMANCIAFARQMLAQNPQCRLLATASNDPREQERLQTLAQAVANERLTTLSGLSIAELAAVLQRCRLHVGADSGVLHLAVAVGLPTVSLFRDYHDASAWTPTGPAHRVFRAPCRCVNQREQPCAADNRAECLGRLEAETLAAAAQAQLQIAAPTSSSYNRLAEHRQVDPYFPIG